MEFRLTQEQLDDCCLPSPKERDEIIMPGLRQLTSENEPVCTLREYLTKGLVIKSHKEKPCLKKM